MTISEARLAVAQVGGFKNNRPVTGSGFFIDKTTIMTAAHVVQEVTNLQIKYEGTIYEAEVVTFNTEIDAAIIKTKGVVPLVTLKFYSGKLKNGMDLNVLGYPLGVESITGGPLLSQGRLFQHDDRAVAIDVMIAPGNSGGPILTKDNEVIGVVSAIIPHELGRLYGIGYRTTRINKEFKR